MATINKQNAANALSVAWAALYEVQTLREFTNKHGLSNEQAEVLNNVINEKIDIVFDAVDFVDGYFNQRPRKKKQTANKITPITKAA